MPTPTPLYPILPSYVTGTNYVGLMRAFETYNYLDKMIAERDAALGNEDSPRSSRPRYRGVVPSNLTASGFTDSAASGVWKGGTDDTSGTLYTNPFAGAVRGPSETRTFPASNEWWIQFDDPYFEFSHCAKVKIVGWTGAGVMVLDPKDLLNLVAAGVIPSIDFLKGRVYKILGFTYAVARQDRILEWPNDRQYAAGVVQSLAAVTARATTGTNIVTLKPASPTPNVFRPEPGSYQGSNATHGKDFLVYDTGGYLRRTVLSNATNKTDVWYLNGATWTANVGQPWGVVDTGGREIPGRKPCFPYWAYRGYVEGYVSHDVDDMLGSAGLPVRYIKIPGVDADGNAALVPVQAFGQDVFTDADGDDDNYTVGGRPLDKCYTPDIPKTINDRQRRLVAMASGGWVENIDPTGNPAIPQLNPAEIARIAKALQAAVSSVWQTITVWTGTTGAVEGSSGDDGSANSAIAISGLSAPPFYPIRVWYSVHRADGTYNAGFGILTAANRLLAHTIGDDTTAFTQSLYHSDTGVTDPGDNGNTVIFWPGFTRYPRTAVKRLADQAGNFIADINVADDGTRTAIDPGEPVAYTNGLQGTGRMRSRKASTHYIDRASYDVDPGTVEGIANEGTATNSAFVVGDNVRWSGDCFMQPTVDAGGNSFFQDGTDPTLPYWDRFYAGRLSSAHQGARDAKLSGKVTENGAFYLRDSNRAGTNSWYADPTVVKPDGIMRTESGTATGGSSTTLTDSIAANVTNVRHAHWTTYHWPTSDFPNGPFSGCTCRVDHGTGTYRGTFDPLYTDQRLIVAGTTNGTLAWAEAMRATASGKPYAIDVPYFMNRYKGRSTNGVLLTLTNGASLRVTNTGNSGDVLFFNAGTNVLASGSIASYLINVDMPGGVWRAHGTTAASFTPSTGTDTTRLGVPGSGRAFTSLPNFNLESYSTRWGFFLEGDAVAPEILNEMFFFARAMQATANYNVQPHNYSSDGGTGETNQVEAGITDPAEGGDPSVKTLAFSQGKVTGAWGGASVVPFSGGGSTASTDGTPTQASVFVGWRENLAQTAIQDISMSASAAYAYYNVTGIPLLRGLNPSVTVYGFGAMSSTDDGTAVQVTTYPTSGGSLSLFSPGSTGLLFHAFSSIGTASGTSSSRWTGKVGDTSMPPWPTLTEHVFGPDSQGYAASGGYFLARPTAIQVFAFTY